MSEPRGKGVGRIKRGEPIRAGFLNRIAEAADMQAVGGAGTVTRNVGGRSIISAVGRCGIVALTPTNGIPAASSSGDNLTAGSAECTIYMPTETGWSKATNSVVTVWNMMTNAVSGSTRVQCKVIDSRFVVDVEPC
jgi:hypothetical protein